MTHSSRWNALVELSTASKSMIMKILMVNPSIRKASLNVVIALTGVPSFVFRTNQSAADRADGNGPSELDRTSIT